MSENDELRWTRTDESVALYNFPDHIQHVLIYGRIYTAHMPYSFSKTNQLIKNLKIKPSDTENRKYYKGQSISKFSIEAERLFRHQLNGKFHYEIVPIPPSKTQSHPDFDNRLDLVAEKLSLNLSNVKYLPLLNTNRDMEAYHESGKIRNSEDILQTLDLDLSIAKQHCETSPIVLLDDVLTSGAHFSACRQKILNKWPEAKILGVFWAKVESPSDFDDLIL